MEGTGEKFSEKQISLPLKKRSDIEPVEYREKYYCYH